MGKYVVDAMKRIVLLFLILLGIFTSVFSTSHAFGGVVTSNYGKRIHPLYGTEKDHTGIDFAFPIGTPLPAALSGKIETGYDGGFGRWLTIEAPNGETVLYAHLDDFPKYITNGVFVQEGQVVAFSGNSGGLYRAAPSF